MARKPAAATRPSGRGGAGTKALQGGGPDTFNGDDLREWREEHGFTQHQLADALGVHPNTIPKWERGDQSIQQPRLLRLALKAIALEGAR